MRFSITLYLYFRSCLCLVGESVKFTNQTQTQTQTSVKRISCVTGSFLFSLPSLLCIHFVYLYPQLSFHLFLYNTNTHAQGGIFFCILLYIICTSSIVVPLSWWSCILPFVSTYNTEHEPAYSRRDSKPQFQQAIDSWPSPYNARPPVSADSVPRPTRC
jgi:hypothetical protein